MSKKTIRVIVKTIVTLESELPIDEAIKDFANQHTIKYIESENAKSKVIKTDWVSTEGISYTQINNSGTEIILKPIKNDNETRY